MHRMVWKTGSVHTEISAFQATARLLCQTAVAFPFLSCELVFLAVNEIRNAHQLK